MKLGLCAALFNGGWFVKCHGGPDVLSQPPGETSNQVENWAGGLGKTGACKRSIPKKVDANDNFSVNVIINNSYNDMINKLNNVMN